MFINIKGGHLDSSMHVSALGVHVLSVGLYKNDNEH